MDTSSGAADWQQQEQQQEEEQQQTKQWGAFTRPAAPRVSSGVVWSSRLQQKLSDVDSSVAIATVCQGDCLMKWCKKGFAKPHKRTFRVDAETLALIWESPNKPTTQTTIFLDSVLRITPGEDADFWRNKPERNVAIEIRGVRTVRIACSSLESWGLWMKGLLLLHEKALTARCSSTTADLICLEWQAAEKDEQGRFSITKLSKLLSSLNVSLDPRYQEHFFRTYDSQGIGSLNFQDFRQMMRELLLQPDIQLYFDLFKLPTEAYISEEGYGRFLKEVQGVDSPEDFQEEMELFRNANDTYKKTRPGCGSCLTLLGFNSLLCSAANGLMMPKRQTLHQSLSHPLCNYWINSSHNTYLCGDQVVGRSAVGQYIDLLLSGCRCVELDCWNGADGEPVLFHGVGGYQLTGRIRFRDAIQACKDYGFQRSKLPIILSLEMHCSTAQKARITEIINEILGDSVYQCHPTTPLPSPESLLECFLIKSKVINELGEFEEEGDEEDINMDSLEIQLAQELESQNPSADFLHANQNLSVGAFCSARTNSSSAAEQSSCEATSTTAAGGGAATAAAAPPMHMGTTAESANDAKAERQAAKLEKLKAFQRNICLRGKKLKGFDLPRNPMDICSMNESKLLRLAKQSPLELCLFHQKYLSRIYPAGTRLSSSNFNPTVCWNLGSQIVALNLQSMGLATMLNHGRFQDNGGVHGGYVLKPSILRDPQRPFDAIAANPPEPEALHLTIRILSAHQLPRPATDGRRVRSAALNKLTTRSRQFQTPFVTVSVHGSRRDTRSFRTPAIPNNSFNPRWANDESTFEFFVSHPSLALLLFRVCTADVRPELICFACFPVDAVRPGLRWVSFQDCRFRLLRFSGMLVFVRIIKVKQPPTGSSVGSGGQWQSASDVDVRRP